MILRSVHIAVANPSWGGFGDLGAIESQAGELGAFAEAKGFETTVLNSAASTGFLHVCKELESAVEAVKDGGYLFVSFAGHGFFTNGFEERIRHREPCRIRTSSLEYWVLQDKGLCDIDLRSLFARCSASTRIVCLSDACYGLGISPPDYRRWLLKWKHLLLSRFAPWLSPLARVSDGVGLSTALVASGAVISPATEVDTVPTGFSSVFVSALAANPSSFEALRADAETRWRRSRTLMPTLRTCLRAFGPEGEAFLREEPFNVRSLSMTCEETGNNNAFP